MVGLVETKLNLGVVGMNSSRNQLVSTLLLKLNNPIIFNSRYSIVSENWTDYSLINFKHFSLRFEEIKVHAKILIRFRHATNLTHVSFRPSIIRSRKNYNQNDATWLKSILTSYSLIWQLNVGFLVGYKTVENLFNKRPGYELKCRLDSWNGSRPAGIISTRWQVDGSKSELRKPQPAW